MKIMLDSNILISTAIFHKSIVSEKVKLISSLHQIYICSYALDEYYATIEEKFPDKKQNAEIFIKKMEFNHINTPAIFSPSDYPYIRDPKDIPILVSAIIANVDILLTGDKDLLEVDIKRPEILSIREFVDRYPRYVEK